VNPTGRAATDLLLHSLLSLRPVEVAFAARADAATGLFVLDRFEGVRTTHLKNLRFAPTKGLAGRCITGRRSVRVTDYPAAREITHEFDRQVTAEGLRAVFAVPVLDKGAVSEVVYGAARRPFAFSDRLIGSAQAMVARSALDVRATERVVQEGLARRMRDVRAELRGLADEIPDPALRDRLLKAVDSIPAAVPGPRPLIRLTPRELDVLSCAARGCGNRQIAHDLGLTEQTVKSYLRAAMAKLNSRTRGEAVYRARGAGLLV
jgi:DNA-binding CsgD family transcriptional regulator